MLDQRLRQVKDLVLLPLSRLLLAVPPTAISVVGLGFGLLAALLLAQQQYGWALALWLLNRLCDGLDGAVARLGYRQSDLGGYLDILFDFVVYAAIPVALVVGAPSEASWLALAVLLASFYVNAASWMFLAALLEKRGHSARHRAKPTAVTMPAGLIGGTETILFYTLFMLWPAQMAALFWLMSLLVAITVVQRVVWAVRRLD
ncbi:MAG: hypothetical protein Kow0031_04690 [Anaerolineae bacterium]